MKYPINLELISSNQGDNLFRLKVPNGWIVERTLDGAIGICFVPDPEHIWEIDNKEEI